MRFVAFSFGSIGIDGITYEYDVVIDEGKVRKRKKKPSKESREDFGHTPLSIEEKIPWKCRNWYSNQCLNTSKLQPVDLSETVCRELDAAPFAKGSELKELRERMTTVERKLGMERSHHAA